MTEQNAEEKARVAAEKVKQKLKRRRREASFERALRKNLQLETELSRAALFEAGVHYQMYDAARELEARRTKTPRYVV
jgi:hypothetical protein